MLIKKKMQLHTVEKGDGHGGMGTSTTPSSKCITFLMVGRAVNDPSRVEFSRARVELIQ
jgi:hypothetical protein